MHSRNLNGFCRFALVMAISMVAGCGGDEAPADETSTRQAESPREFVVLLDRSGSVTETEVLDHKRLLSDLVGRLSFGDRLVLLVAHANGVRDGTAPVVAEMPPARNPLHPLSKEQLALQVGKQMAKQSVEAAFSVADVPATDLLASIHTAADQFYSDRGAKRAIVLMSDMLQCASGVCFERPGTVPTEAWVAQQQKAGTIPDLAGVCVVAIGPDPSTAHGVMVRDFWEVYFEAAGAEFRPELYRHSIPDASAVNCG